MQHSDVSGFAANITNLWRKRENTWPLLTLMAITAVAWAYTIHQTSVMSGMSMSEVPSAGADHPVVEFTLFISGWTVMMVAMMLPVMLPLVLLYRHVSRKRAGRFQVFVGIAALLSGYLGLWALAGLPVYAYEIAVADVHAATALLPSLLLIAGGIYQFSALKQSCHTRCSNPLSFLMQQWRPGTTGAVRLGILHGMNCLGCCAGLMVGLVALGMMNLALMLSAAIIIFIEKTVPGGHYLALPLGMLMVVAGITLFVVALFGGQATIPM